MRSNGLRSSLRILRIFPFTNGKKKSWVSVCLNACGSSRLFGYFSKQTLINNNKGISNFAIECFFILGDNTVGVTTVNNTGIK